MKGFLCFAILLATTTARAETYSATVTREGNTVTVSGPNTTVTTTRTSQTPTSATYSTTVTRNGQSGSYQPMGASGYRPMGR